MSYYDAYDSRPRPSRRTDSFTRQREGAFMTPAAGHASTSHHERVGEMNDRHRTPRSHRASYDPRYYYPPPPPPDNGRPGPPRASPTTRRRFSWPPQPTVEDEVVSLAKEAGTSKLLKEVGKDEAQSRGTIDQEPIVQEVPELINQNERRFVLSSDSEKETKSNGVPTPPTSEDERARKLRRKPSRLNTDLDNGAPEVARRAASPYAMNRPTKLKKDVSSTDRYLSPTTLTPPPTDSGRRRRDRYSMSSKVSSPRRDSVRVSPSARRGNDYFSAGYGSSDNAIVDDEYDTSDSASYNGRRQPRGPSTQKDAPKSSPQTSVVDFASMPAANAPPIRRLNLDARRNTDTANTLPTLPSLRVDKTRRPSPLMAAGALSDLSDSAVYSAPGTPGSADMFPPARSRESSFVSSRGVSPASNVSRNEQTPPRSPRFSSEFSNAQANSGSPTSGTTSASPSRPASPSPRTPGETPRLPRTELDWSTLLAANAVRRTKPPSRLATSTRQDSLPDVPQMPYSAGPFAGPSGRPNANLPYPEEYGPGTPTMYMPSERDHQYFPPAQPLKPALGVPFATTESKTLSRAASPAPSNASYTSTGSKPSRPALTSRHSVAASPNHERPKPNEGRKVSFTSSSQTKKELAALLKKGLPDCRRAEPVAGKDDWYTVIGCPALTFCEQCVDSVFKRTVYRPSIRRLPQLNFSEKVRCSLGSSAWMRLAWLLTLQQHRIDLELLKDLAEIEDSSEPCPGSQEAVRSWYGLRDNEGYFVRDFHVCYADVRKIERLLPTLSGFFVRMPGRASYGSYHCSMRAEGNRYSTYLDALITTHERAISSRKGPDTMPFIDLVERKSRLRECTKDNMLMNGLWHFMPNAPTFTVCEDCFDAIVEPEIRKNSDIAMRFNRTVQPVYGEGMGSSCQLYSNRMRKAFRRAIADKDLNYLVRKSKERRGAEVRLQERYRDIQRRAKRMSREDSGSEDDERRLNREVEKITKEWKDQWE